jgi:hypothetical protein
VTKSRRVRWTGKVIFTREKINSYKILVGNSKGRRTESKGLDGKIILKRKLNQFSDIL